MIIQTFITDRSGLAWQKQKISPTQLFNFHWLIHSTLLLSEFKDQRTVNKNPKKYKPVSETVRKILKDKMALEYELYEFLKQRLHQQFESIADLLKLPTTKIHSRSTEKAALSSWDRMDIELRHWPFQIHENYIYSLELGITHSWFLPLIPLSFKLWCFHTIYFMLLCTTFK